MPTSNKKFTLLTGNAHPALAQKIARELKTLLLPIETTIFPNQEMRVRLKKPVRNQHVFIFQPISPPPDHHLIEFLLLVDAAKQAGAKKITGIIPWLGYSPQDKIFRPGEPLSSKLIANLLKTAGVDSVILLDIHSPENLKHLKQARIQAESLSALPVFVEALKNQVNPEEWVVLCLDKGARERSQEFADQLGLPLVSLKKSRDRGTGEVTFNDFTQDLTNKKIVSFDDFVSTGGSRIKASALVKKLGARAYVDCITHGLLGADSPQKIQQSDIDRLYLTDSYPVPAAKRVAKIKLLTCAPLLAGAIRKHLQR